jgi:hypothetical protein
LTTFLGGHPDHKQAGAVGRERDLRGFRNNRPPGDDRETGKTGTRDAFNGPRSNARKIEAPILIRFRRLDQHADAIGDADAALAA